MKKLLMVLVTIVAIFTFVGCGSKTPTLKIYQNKVEIGDVLSTYAQAWGEANGVDVQVTTCGGSACGYQDELLNQFQGKDQPDLFVIEGMGDYNTYKDYIAPLTGADWLADTTLALTVDGTPYGFPVSVEGWGLAYNKDILDAAGVDPADLTSLDAYKTAFATIQQYFDDNDMTDSAVVSMAAAGQGVTWVTGLHNFNGYLSSGLNYTDSTVIDKLNNGQVDATRLAAYADWVELLFQYADETVLTQGDYDAQVAKFDTGKAAFIHQGNWIDPNLVKYFEDNDETPFPMGFAPAAAASGTCDKVFAAAPSYYVLNVNSKYPDTAKQFLSDMVYTQAGQDYIVNKAGMIAAFTNITMTPDGPLSSNLAKWVQSGDIYAWWQNNMPNGFGMNELGPIFANFATGTIDKAEFISQVTQAIEDIPSHTGAY